ncbi:MAG: signal recognition particle-docking protein FtsY [Actinomycetota bacterium]|nr:signal recognition particle-docking protein FtsY [Actinomycetota bacterium]
MTALLIALAIVGVIVLATVVLGTARRSKARRITGTPRDPERKADRPVPQRPGVRDRLTKSRRFLSDHLATVFGHPVDDDTWDDLEAVLIQADVGADVARRITEDLKAKARAARISTPEEARSLLADELVSMFDQTHDRGLAFSSDGVTIWLIVGVNGSGKTTTIGKLATDARERGRSVSLAAADTFRAAADEQLSVWAERAGASIVKHQPGADPGAVAFDAVQHAQAKGIDVLIVDTAGRLHTKTPLMDELAKIRRVIEKEHDVAEALITIDATGGQNALVQAREFAQAAGVTGVVLTKLDGTAKGGIAIAIEQSLGIPIKLVGLGEGIDDLEPFDPKVFIDALLS